MSTCPFCQVSIAATATLCEGCGRSLGPVALKLPATLKSETYQITQVLRRHPSALVYGAIHTDSGSERVIWEFAPAMAERKPNQAGLRGTYRHLPAVQANLAHLMQIRHPSLWTPTELVQENNTLYAVFDPPAGPSLEAIVGQQGPLEADRVLRLGQQAAQILNVLHTRQLLHLSLSPSDLYLGPQDQLVLGLPDPAGTIQLEHGAAARFAAPEQGSATVAVTVATDLFSLSATLWYALTGQPPTYPLPHESDPSPLVQTLSASLNPAANERPQNLQQWLALLGASAAPLSSPLSGPRHQSRRALWVAAAAVLGLGLGGYLGLRGAGQPPVSLAEAPQKTVTLSTPAPEETREPTVPPQPEAAVEPVVPTFPSDPPPTPAPVPVPTRPDPASNIPTPASEPVAPAPAAAVVGSQPQTATIPTPKPVATNPVAPQPTATTAPVPTRRPATPVPAASRGAPTIAPSPTPIPLPRIEPLNPLGRATPAARAPSVKPLTNPQANPAIEVLPPD